MPRDFDFQTKQSGLNGWRLLLAILTAAALLLAMPVAAQATNVYAAASLREAFQKIDGSDDVTYNFAGSGALRDQIKAGAPADVFAAASPDEPQDLFTNGNCERPVTFATNEVAMLVPAGNPSGIQSIYDLETGNRAVAIGIEDVPIGKYTREVLGGMGLLGILDTNTITEEPNVTGITSKVALGEVDVGFAYVTDGMIVADQGVQIIRLPEGSQPAVRYQICVVKRDGADTEGAEAYIKKVTGQLGRGILSEAGFGLPPDPADVVRKQKKVRKIQQRVKNLAKNKNRVCRKAGKARQRRAGNAGKLRNRCTKAKKNLSKARKDLRKARKELKEAEDAVKNA